MCEWMRVKRCLAKFDWVEGVIAGEHLEYCERGVRVPSGDLRRAFEQQCERHDQIPVQHCG